MSEVAVRRIVDEFIDAWNSENPDLVSSMFSQAGQMNCAGVAWAMEGPAIHDRISTLLRDCPGMRFSVRETIVLSDDETADRSEVVVRWKANVPDAISGEAGAREVSGMDRLTIEAGKVTLLDSFYDRTELAADLLLASKRV